MTPIAPAQRKCIFALVRELGWDDDMRHDMFQRWISKPSISATAERPVTSFEAAQIIHQLDLAVKSAHRQRAFQKKRRRRHWPENQATPEQVNAIRALSADVFANQTTKFRAWLRSRFKVDAIDWLSPKSATACILALKQMRSSGWRPNTPSPNSSCPTAST